MNLNYFKKNKAELVPIIIIFLYAYFVNRLSANLGFLSIDTFGFLDPGYSILHGKLPIRDFWIFTGLFVDYLEALFLFVFGNNWNSHVLHASFINILVTLSFFYFLKKNGLTKIFSLFYALSFATLCYPVSGTPFAYLHAYTFSLIALMVLCFAIKNNNYKLWFIIPVISTCSFLSMQTPSIYIIFLIALFAFHFFFKKKNFKSFKFFVLGILFSLSMIILYLIISKTKFESFLYQYFLFPFSLGEGRMMNDDLAYLTLKDQLNFKRIFQDFKFIHLFLIPLIFITFRNIQLKKKNFIIINSIFIFSSIFFIFNQLLTANQIFIFSLIPFLAAIIHLNIYKQKNSKFFIASILVLVLIVTTKFHVRYNLDRKFHDLENVDKSKAMDASIIHKNLKGLKWVSQKYPNPIYEIKVIQKAVNIINNDERKIMLITHYNFISTILGKDLNIMNRWYLWDNNTHPTENHKYFNFYKKMVNEKLKKDNIQVIYLLGKKMKFEQIKKNFTELCFESTSIEAEWFSSHKIIKCGKK